MLEEGELDTNGKLVYAKLEKVNGSLGYIKSSLRESNADIDNKGQGRRCRRRCSGMRGTWGCWGFDKGPEG